MTLDEGLRACPLIAILRGVRPSEVVWLGSVLVEAGFRIVEVPLNSPDPFKSIGALADRFPDILVGAGTVMSPDAVRSVKEAGGRLVLMPHGDPVVVRSAKEHGLACVPGVATPTEAFAALAAGADALKMFPAELLPPVALGAWRAVLPAGTRLLPVGGITPDKIAGYRASGAAGFGLGSALYKPGMDAAALAVTAAAFMGAVADRG